MKRISLETVLHIEDDADIRNAVRFGLQSLHGIHVRVCTSGREGLLAASTYAADLLLLDVMMPEIDGPMALAGLRQHAIHRDTPAIFLTAFSDDDDLQYYRSLGAAGVIAKPFDPEQLYPEISRILKRYKQSRPMPSMWAELSILNRVFSRELTSRMATIHFAIDRIREDPFQIEHRLRLCELISDLRTIATGFGQSAMAQAAYRAELRLSGMNRARDTDFHDLSDIESELVRYAC